ncbi:Na+/melibiose symporter [Sanguibacter gelidistatuariae]|uniref:Na+/melibiose symporter n=1 Tax=Sanguibacter gelidistatuariae TaxID=1814289 RepID=A0A1G6HES2_9MICO|nr:MFS transporter [Sanguibacter gelidistatuariae]SDB92807.1 Na+/melibiose symporter [Sanguibacter gelidistatuariae]
MTLTPEPVGAAAAAPPGEADLASGPTPTTRASRAWVTKFTLAYLGINIVWAGPAQVLMSPQVERLTTAAPWGFFSDTKETNLALIGFITGVFAMISTPLWGALSDRTSTRWGRRTPWMAVGLVIVTIAMIGAGLSQTLPALLLSWVAFQVAINAVISPLSATVPDHVPTEQRGLVSGWYGFAYTFAVVTGTALGTIATAVWAGALGITMGYVICALACVVAMTPFLLDRWERRGDAPARPTLAPFRWADLRACYWVDVRRYPDFGWAWLTRFIVTLSSATALFYLYYYLQDGVGLVRDDAASGAQGGLRVSDGVLVLTAVYALSVFLTVVVAGIVSDKLGRRRVFVASSAVFVSTATLLMAFVPTFSVTVVAAIILGLGTGVFTSVDFALVTEVLPAAESNGKDIGIINLAIALPNVLSPVVAAFMVNSFGGYTGLYLLSGALSILGGVLVYRIKGVR